jgi:prolyl oligopeptidase PreP (S9A serine peptidase family)
MHCFLLVKDMLHKALISMHQLHISIKWPAILLWQGGKDDQVPPITFENFVAHLNEKKQKKNEVILYPKVYTPLLQQN